MGPFLTGEDEYSPDFNLKKQKQNRLKEAGSANVLGPSKRQKGVSTSRELLATTDGRPLHVERHGDCEGGRGGQRQKSTG